MKCEACDRGIHLDDSSNRRCNGCDFLIQHCDCKPLPIARAQEAIEASLLCPTFAVKELAFFLQGSNFDRNFVHLPNNNCFSWDCHQIANMLQKEI